MKRLGAPGLTVITDYAQGRVGLITGVRSDERELTSRSTTDDPRNHRRRGPALARKLAAYSRTAEQVRPAHAPADGYRASPAVELAESHPLERALLEKLVERIVPQAYQPVGWNAEQATFPLDCHLAKEEPLRQMNFTYNIDTPYADGGVSNDDGTDEGVKELGEKVIKEIGRAHV